MGRSGDLRKRSLADPHAESFFTSVSDGSRGSAESVVPVIIELIKPKSIVDLGCGVGAWLAVFRECGIDDVLGIDGEYVDRSMLQIDDQHFLAFDLRRPLQLNRKFDLALCLEVAEHLPPDCARTLVNSLVRIAPAVLFSAAIPHQGGTNHLNEQWPSYWAGLFKEKGYVGIDCVRTKIWASPAVDWWYAQNMLLFVAEDRLKDYPAIVTGEKGSILELVHRKNYEAKVSMMFNQNTTSLRQLLSLFPVVAWKALARRIGGFGGKSHGRG